MSHRKLLYKVTITEIAFCTKSTYRRHGCYGISTRTMHPDLCSIDTGSCSNLVSETRIVFKWSHRNHCKKMPNLRFTTQQSLHKNSQIHFHVRFGAVCIRIWFDIVPNFAVGILLGTWLIDHFIRSVFPSNRKVDLWLFHFVAISDSSKISTSSNSITTFFYASLGNNNNTNDEFKETPSSNLMGPQAWLQPHLKCCVMITTSAFVTRTAERKILEGTCHQ